MVDSMEKKKIIEIEMNSMHELNSAYANAIIKFKDHLKQYVDFGDYNIWNSEIKLLKVEFSDNERGVYYTAIFEIELFE